MTGTISKLYADGSALVHGADPTPEMACLAKIPLPKGVDNRDALASWLGKTVEFSVSEIAVDLKAR